MRNISLLVKSVTYKTESPSVVIPFKNAAERFILNTSAPVVRSYPFTLPLQQAYTTPFKISIPYGPWMVLPTRVVKVPPTDLAKIACEVVLLINQRLFNESHSTLSGLL